MKASTMRVRNQSNLDVDNTIEMSFDQKGQAKLAAILINLYSDLASAIIREYSANAWDSHKAAGQTRPIEITLPTAFKPDFRVKDYGVGMSLDDIREIYSKYGASTKDTDDEQIGSYGLGCKSALSIAPSFTITAIKDGIKNVVIMAREEKTLGRITPVVQIPTDEPNGVEISIAISSDYREFAQKVSQVFFTWEKGTVLINGEEPKDSMYNEDKYMPLGNDSYLSVASVDSYYNQHYGSDNEAVFRQGLIVNMGGIGYPVEAGHFNHLIELAKRKGSVSPGKTKNHCLIVNVPIGSVDLIPSRESIQWTNRSSEFVATRLKDTYRLVLETVIKKIDSYQTREELFCTEVMEMASSFSDYFQNGDITWKGERFPTALRFDAFKANGDNPATSAAIYYNGRKANRTYEIGFNFGFGHWNRGSIEIAKKDGSFNDHWVFVDCQGSDLSGAELHHHMKSVMKAKNLAPSVNVVYVKDDLLTKNIWLKAAIDNKATNLQKMSIDEFVSTSIAYRKEQSRLARLASKKEESPYVVSIAGKDSRGNSTREVKSMLMSQIKAEVEANPSLQVFADEIIFSTKNKEHEKSSEFFLPDNAVIVYMRGARKADTFVKKAPFPVRVDLAQFMADALVERIEKIGFENYFSNVYLSTELRSFGRQLKLDGGFLSAVFAKDTQDYDARIILDHMNVYKMVEGAIMPEIPFVVKSRQIVEEGCLFFEDPMPWSMDSRSKAYTKQMKSYILGISDTIEKIAQG